MTRIKPKQKALIATLFFTAFGLTGFALNAAEWQTTLPLFIFYLILVFNTYFSVGLFSSIIPTNNTLQKVIDLFLLIIYTTLAFSVSNPMQFIYSCSLLFIVASAKYVFLIGLVEQPKLLKRKILVDLSGVLACLFAFGGVITGHRTLSLWSLTLVFAFANTLLFSIWPLYHLD